MMHPGRLIGEGIQVFATRRKKLEMVCPRVVLDSPCSPLRGPGGGG